MSKVSLLPIVECLELDHLDMVLDGLPVWLRITNQCVVVVPPGRAYKFFGRLIQADYRRYIIPGLKARGTSEMLFDRDAWAARIEEAIFATHFLNQDMVWWDVETILRDYWKCEVVDVPDRMRRLTDALLPIKPFGITSIWPVGAYLETYELHELPIRTAIQVGCGSVIFTEAQCGRYGWNDNVERATLIVRRSRNTRAGQMPILYLQSVGGIDVPQPDYQRMYRADEALRAAELHGGTVGIYPSLEKFKVAGEELEAAMQKAQKAPEALEALEVGDE